MRVKKIISSIAEPLAHIFNLSIQTGCVPDTYKIAKVIPIFKAGNKQDPNNYRPISLLPAFSKILEKIVYNRLIHFLNQCDLVYPRQYGFLRGRSTEQAMLDIIHQISNAIEGKSLTLGLFLDLSKAFDSIPHDILIRKLYRYGIRGISNDWFKLYLSNRSQFVQTNSRYSSYKSVTFGVPQGSVLGPLLFLLYVNDMPTVSSIIDFILFADDTTCLYNSADLDDLYLTLDNEIKKLEKWFSANKLLLNASKSNLILFTTRQKFQHISLQDRHFVSLNSCIIKCTSEVKFLGIFLDKNLNFNSHLKHVGLKITKALFALKRSAKILSSNMLKTLYSALILPYLNYGLLIWGGSCKLQSKYKQLDKGESSNPMGPLSRIHSLQKQSIRVIARAGYTDHHIPLCYDLCILDLPDLYNVKAMSLFYDFFHGLLPSSLSNLFHIKYNASNNIILTISCRRTNIAASSISHTLPGIWNPLPDDLKQLINKSKGTFISSIKSFYISRYKDWKCMTTDCYSCKKSAR